MDNHVDVYRVTMFNRAYRDLDGIYDYIANGSIGYEDIVEWINVHAE